MSYKFRRNARILALAMLAISSMLLVAACGGGNQLVYQVSGAAEQAEVTYIDGDGVSKTETVALPWETTFQVGSSAEFSLIANNTSEQKGISCAVLLNEKELGRVDANYYASCEGNFKKSGSNLTTGFHSGKDVLPGGIAAGPKATPTPAPPTATPTPKPTSTPTVGERIEQGLAYYKQGELDKAAAEYKEAITLEPDNADAHRNLGTVYIDQRKWEEAAAAYEEAIRLNPDFGEAYGDMVAAYVNLGKLPEAIEAGEKGIELAPDYATGHNNLGVAYNKQGQTDKAVAEWEETIRLDPDDALPHYNLGNVAYKRGQVDQAMAEWQKSIRLDPDYPHTHKNLGIAYSAQEQTAEALTEFETYLKLAAPDAADRPAVEEEIARLKAKLSTPSAEASTQGPQSGKDMLITEDEANAFYAGTWKFDADAEYGDPDPAVCRDFVDDSAENLWYVSFYNCVFDPNPTRTLADSKESYPSATPLDSSHSNELDLLFYGYRSDADHMTYDMLTLQDGRLYMASVTHRNPTLGAGNVPQQSDIDDFLFKVLTANLSKSSGNVSAVTASGVTTYTNKYIGLTLEYPADWTLLDEVTAKKAVILLGSNKEFATARSPEIFTNPGVSIQIGIRDLREFSATNPIDLQEEILKDDYPPLTPINDPAPMSISGSPANSAKGIARDYTADLDGHALRFGVVTLTQGGRVMVVVAIWGKDYEEQVLPAVAQVISSIDLELTTPEILMEVIFLAAQKQDYSFLNTMCHPEVDNDGDTQAICDMADATPAEQAEFAEYFKTGKLTGRAHFNEDGTMAEVPFRFGPKGDREETMKFIVDRDGLIYLYSF